MKCLCFCYLGLELALTRGPVALLGGLTPDAHAAIRGGALALTTATAVFCFVRAIPVVVEGWQYVAGSEGPVSGAKLHRVKLNGVKMAVSAVRSVSPVGSARKTV